MGRHRVKRRRHYKRLRRTGGHRRKGSLKTKIVKTIRAHEETHFIDMAYNGLDLLTWSSVNWDTTAGDTVNIGNSYNACCWPLEANFL